MRLRNLSAELRDELLQVGRTVAELRLAERLPTDTDAIERVRLYAAAAMLDTYYTGVERLLERTARVFGNLPDGPHWHRTLLEASAVDLPGIRPAVLSPSTVDALARYLSFRHRFRNLYLFDLIPSHLSPLIAEASEVTQVVVVEVETFASWLDDQATDF